LKEKVEAIEKKREDVKNLSEELGLSDSRSYNVSSECDPCRKDIRKENHLKMHMKKLLEVESERIELEKKVNIQKLKLMGDILKIKKKELSSDYKCNCKSFCRIFHNKHNWK
jgi:hypothetical protein